MGSSTPPNETFPRHALEEGEDVLFEVADRDVPTAAVTAKHCLLTNSPTAIDRLRDRFGVPSTQTHPWLGGSRREFGRKGEGKCREK